MTDKLIPASKIEALPRWWSLVDGKSKLVIDAYEVGNLIKAAPEVSSEPAWVLSRDNKGRTPNIITGFPTKFDISKLPDGTELYTTTQDQSQLIRELSDALEKAQNGLRWYQDEHPEDGSEADGELHEEIDALLTRAKEAIK